VDKAAVWQVFFTLIIIYHPALVQYVSRTQLSVPLNSEREGGEEINVNGMPSCRWQSNMSIRYLG
jgi:hypothetical protein